MKHGKHPESAVPPEEIPDDKLSLADQMRRKLSTKEGRAAYAYRKKTVEPTFGQIKAVPAPGLPPHHAARANESERRVG